LFAGFVVVVVVFVVAARKQKAAEREAVAARSHEQVAQEMAERARRDAERARVDTRSDRLLGDQPFAPVTDERGIVAAVLVDTSGSMKEKVRDADGVERPKIEIARRCVVNLFEQAERFAREHPDQRVELALYEFSLRGNGPRCRVVLPSGAPSPKAAAAAVARLRPEGDTPIGDALLFARGELAQSGLAHQHLLVVTDGANTKGLPPAEVVSAFSHLPDEQRPSTYLIAFDVDAKQFAPLMEAGALVLSASGGGELQSTLDYLLSGKILAEQPLDLGEGVVR
jgi:Mg-chelatase subunit ChlD